MVNILHQTLTIFALSLLLNSCFAQENIVVKDYEEYFEDVREIELDGKFFDVSYEGDENADRVFLNAYLESPENRGLDIQYRKSGSKLIVEVIGDLSGGWNSGNQRKGYISLTDPEQMKLNMKNSSGSIEVMHVKSNTIYLKVNSGSIKTMNLEVDEIQLAASSGSIKGEGFKGNIQSEVNSGSINLVDVEGNVNAKGSSGSLKFEKVVGVIDARVNSGSMNFVDVTGLGDISVSSGSIKAEKAGLNEKTHLNANSGSIRIRTDSDLTKYNYELSANSGSVRVGDDSSSKRLAINNNSSYTIQGKVNSGSIRIEN